MSGGDCVAGLSLSLLLLLLLPSFSEKVLPCLGGIVVAVGGVYGGGAASLASPLLLPPFTMLVAKSYEGGSRRPKGRGFEAAVAIWQ